MGLHETGLPERIGRYDVVAELASGGMAQIVLARLVGPNGFERPVVIKRILPHLAKQATFVDMFLDEANIVAGIRHPNVVQVQELGHEGAELFLAMEYLEGETASGLLKRLVGMGQRLDPPLAAHLVAQACAGLHAAHELVDAEGQPVNLVHRDVSPQNLFVTYEGQIKVLDFGIAKAADRITRTETGIVKGKHEYMSPEHCVGKPLDRRSDIFALGIVLFELLTGKRLFKRGNHMATFNAICNEPIPRLAEVGPDADPQLEAVVAKALARKKDERYATALDMRRDLLAFVHASGKGADVDSELAALMKRIFAERIEEKREMLRRVHAGSALTHIPPGEVDLSVDIPLVTKTDSEVAGRTTASRWETHVETGRTKAPRRLGVGALILAAGALLAGGGAFAWRHATVTASVPATPASADTGAAASVAPPEAPPAPAPTTSAATQVVVHVETSPPAAHVYLDGKDQGTTPLDLTIARGKSPRSMQVHRGGYAVLSQTIVPDVDQRMLLTLSPRGGARGVSAMPAPASAPAPSPTPTPAPPPTASEGGFHRFD